ncbi:MAG: hypothetical protein R3E87_19705 [Burkholderiaceae bacterium]
MDGRWKLSALNAAWQSSIGFPKEWERKLLAIRAWQQSNPGSEPARLAEANYWVGLADEAIRAPNIPDSVENQAVRTERLTKAMSIVRELTAANPAGCPVIAELQIQLMIAIGADISETRAVYDAASAKYPGYLSLHLAMSLAYAPANGGNPRAFAAFVDEVLERTSEHDGIGMYARLYAQVDNRVGIAFAANRRVRGYPEWPKLRAAYEHLHTRYPGSLGILEHFVSVTCRTEEDALYRSLRKNLPWERFSIRTPIALETCDYQHSEVGIAARIEAATKLAEQAKACSRPIVADNLHCGDHHLQSQDGALLAEHIHQGEFEVADALFEDWCASDARYADGRSRAVLAIKYLAQQLTALRGSPEWTESRLRRWQQDQPESRLLAIMNTLSKLDHAKAVLSSSDIGARNTTALELYRKRLIQALPSVQELAVRSDKRCAAEEVLLLDILIDSGEPLDRIEAYYESRAQASPTLIDLHLHMARRFVPPWDDNVLRYLEFIGAAVERTRSSEGTGMIARLVMLAEDESTFDLASRFAHAPFWPMLRESFDDLVEHHPQSTRILLDYIGIACRSSDSETYRRLRDRVSVFGDDGLMAPSAEACDLRHQWPATSKRL